MVVYCTVLGTDQLSIWLLKGCCFPSFSQPSHRPSPHNMVEVLSLPVIATLWRQKKAASMTYITTRLPCVKE